MEDKKLLRLGVTGTALAAIFCFTPALVLIVSALGLSAVVGWLDYLLLPALAVFASLAVFALVRLRRRTSG